MRTQTPERCAVVADDRSLMRDLLRFALEEQGFAVAGEATTAAAAIDAAAEHRPDVLVVHEGTALGGPEVIERIRTASPGSTVIVVTSDLGSIAPSLTAAADAVVDERAGLQDLPSALGSMRVGVKRISARRRRRPGRPLKRWLPRLQGAVAASVALVGVLLILSAPALHGRMATAYGSLVALTEELPAASAEEAVALSTTLISHRAMLLAEHVDVARLDAEIVEQIAPMLPSLDPDVARAVAAVLGDLLTTGGPPELAPPPAVTPPGSAVETPAADPGDPDVAAPVETPTPIPSAGPPSESPSTGPPSESPSAGPPSESPSTGPPSESPSATETPGVTDGTSPAPAAADAGGPPETG